jgi:S1-C subfamily serine protease
LSEDVTRALFRTAGYSKEKFQLESCIPLAGRSVGIQENGIQDRFLKNGVDHVEGIYECMISGTGFQREQIAIIRSGNKYDILYLNGAPNYRDWTEGEIKGELQSTGNRTIFKATWMDHLRLRTASMFVSVTDGLLTSTQDEDMIWVKVFPTIYDLKAEPNVGLVTGSGFAVSSSGMIATAYHVIEERKEIFCERNRWRL